MHNVCAPLSGCLLYTNPHPGICDVCQSALGGLFPSGSFLPPRQRFFELFPHPLIFSYISFSSGLLWYFLIVIHGLTSSLDMPVSMIRVVHDALYHWPLLSLMPGRDRFRCHFAPSEFELAAVVPDKDLDKYDEYLPESLLAKG